MSTHTTISAAVRLPRGLVSLLLLTWVSFFPYPSLASTTISLDQAVHFLTPGGDNVVVQPGTYAVEAAEDWIRLIPGERRDAILLAAETTTHEESLSVATVISGAGDAEDQPHILLLHPNGTGLDAIGSYSGVRSRALVRRPVRRTSPLPSSPSTSRLPARNPLPTPRLYSPPRGTVLAPGILLKWSEVNEQLEYRVCLIPMAGDCERSPERVVYSSTSSATSSRFSMEPPPNAQVGKLMSFRLPNPPVHFLGTKLKWAISACTKSPASQSGTIDTTNLSQSLQQTCTPFTTALQYATWPLPVPRLINPASNRQLLYPVNQNEKPTFTWSMDGLESQVDYYTFCVTPLANDPRCQLAGAIIVNNVQATRLPPNVDLSALSGKPLYWKVAACNHSIRCGNWSQPRPVRFEPIPFLAQVPYNNIQQKSAHNSYNRDEALLDQLLYHRIRSIEFDIHDSKGGSWPRRHGDWYVYHAHPGDSETTCHRLSDCLQELRVFHDAVPNHEVVTVFMDVIDDWTTGNNPTDLDTRIDSHLPGMVFGPADLTRNCNQARNLQEAVNGNCSWPTLSTLQGKFIFVLTKGHMRDLQQNLRRYYGSAQQAMTRLAFVAPGIENEQEITAFNSVVFFNLDKGKDSLAKKIHNAFGLVSRMYDTPSGLDQDEWNEARQHFVNHLAVNAINFHEDSWSKTHNSHGWPFQCLDIQCPSTLKEEGEVIKVAVQSGDIWGHKDNFSFRYLIQSNNPTSWTTMVSTPNSHVEDFAKGCLMARARISDNAPYFAVCRPADDKRLRVQCRAGKGEDSGYQSHSIVAEDTIDPESMTYIRLEVFGPNNTCARGFGSQNGKRWVQIGIPRCFGSSLQYQGLATSSHGQDVIRFIYLNLQKDNSPVNLDDLSRLTKIGGGEITHSYSKEY